MLARAVGRAREMAIRTALGAARLRLVRQLLTESLLLSFVGGGIGTLVATWGVRAFLALGPANMPRLDEVRVDGAVLLFTAAFTCATAFVFGVVPALHLAGVDTAEALSSTARTGARRGRRVRRLLVVGEVALAFVLVIGAGLMVRSFVRLRQVDPGFDPTNLLTARISLPAQYDTDGKTQQFYERAIEKIRAVPGVKAAGASTRMALEGYSWTGDLAIQGRPEVWGRELRHKEIVPGYFEPMRLPVVAGRTFTTFDNEKVPPVVVVNRALVREFFAGENPVGRQISFTKPTDPPRWQTTGGQVLRIVLADALRLCAIGVGVGTLAALAMGRWLSGLLIETPWSDPTTFVGVALFLMTVTAVASWVPARRAARVDPVTALRAEWSKRGGTCAIWLTPVHFSVVRRPSSVRLRCPLVAPPV